MEEKPIKGMTADEAREQSGLDPIQDEIKELGLVTKVLPCVLTEKELLEKAKSLAYQISQYNALDEEKGQVMADFKSRLKAINNQINDLKNQIANEKEYRNVSCVESANFTENSVTTTRMDTGEIIDTRVMEGWERQQHLPLSEEEKEKEENQAELDSEPNEED